MLPSFPLFVYLKKYDTFSEYFASVSQKNKLTNTYYAGYLNQKNEHELR